jgi:hypothetical protein
MRITLMGQVETFGSFHPGTQDSRTKQKANIKRRYNSIDGHSFVEKP